MLFLASLTLLAGLFPSGAQAYYTWAATKNMFVFGASYTTVGWNISNGINAPVPFITSANGPNWVMALNQRYNITPIALYDIAWPGATVDSSLVYETVAGSPDLVTQVSLWQKHIQHAVPWTSEDSLFLFWPGMNDVVNSMSANTSTAATRPALYTKIMKQYMAQLDILYKAGARNFLIVGVPPMGRTPLFVAQGEEVADAANTASDLFNTLLKVHSKGFVAQRNTTQVAKKNGWLGQVKIFDVHALFTVLLDNADVLGFYDIKNFCLQYAYDGITVPDTRGANHQLPGCLPTSAYFWLNTLHPLWTVHDHIAKAIQRLLS